MQAEAKPIIIFVVIIILFGQLFGEITAPCKLIIPTAKGVKGYDAVITVTQMEIMINCSKKIFQPFNEFDVPRQSKIKLPTVEVYKIQISIKKNEILLLDEGSLYQQYKHLFHPVWRTVQFLPYHEERKEALIFIMDNPAAIKTLSEELIKVIGNRCEVIS